MHALLFIYGIPQHHCLKPMRLTFVHDYSSRNNCYYSLCMQTVVDESLRYRNQVVKYVGFTFWELERYLMEFIRYVVNSTCATKLYFTRHLPPNGFFYYFPSFVFKGTSVNNKWSRWVKRKIAKLTQHRKKGLLTNTFRGYESTCNCSTSFKSWYTISPTIFTRFNATIQILLLLWPYQMKLLLQIIHIM